MAVFNYVAVEQSSVGSSWKRNWKETKRKLHTSAEIS